MASAAINTARGLLLVRATHLLRMLAAIRFSYQTPVFYRASHGGLGNNTAALATPLGSIAMGSSIDVGSSAVGKTSGANMVVGPNESDFVSIFGNTDSDYYSFNVSSAVKLSAVLTPQGGMFDQAQQTTPQVAPTPFDATNRNDLTFTLFGTDGTSQLALVNNTAAGLAETLSGFTLPSAGQYYVRVTGATASAVQLYDLRLSVAAAIIVLPGDYNHDGVVNAADYTVWRDSLGRTGSGLAADGNGDNVVNAADYTVWQTHFGQIAGSGSGANASVAVPEPASLVLLTLAVAGVSLRRHRSA